MPLATSQVVAAGVVATQAGASKLLHRLEDLGVIWSPGSLPPIGGKPNGRGCSCRDRGRRAPSQEIGWAWSRRPTRTTRPSDDSPGPVFEPGAVPIEAQNVGVAVEPPAERVDQPGMGDAIRARPAGSLDGVAAAACCAGAVVARHGVEDYAIEATPPASTDGLVEWALRRAPDAANAAGFDLACQLRDARVDHAKAVRAMLSSSLAHRLATILHRERGDEVVALYVLVGAARASAEWKLWRPPRAEVRRTRSRTASRG